MLMENEWILLNALIYDIYTKKDERQMRQKLMERLSFLIDYDVGLFFRRIPADTVEFGDVLVYTGYEKIKPEAERTAIDYQNNYQEYDYAGNLLSSGENIIYRETDVMPDEMRIHTEYYKKVYELNGWHYSMHGNISYQGEFVGIISFFRNKGKVNYTQKDVYILEKIKNHLAYRMYQDFEETKKMNMSLDECVERYQLTNSEARVLAGILEGKDNPKLCEELVISSNTLKKHIANIYKKTELNSRVQLLKNIKK